MNPSLPPSALIYPPSHAQPLSASLSTAHYGNWRVWGDAAERPKEKGGEKEKGLEGEGGFWRSEAQPFPLSVSFLPSSLSFCRSFSRSRGRHLLWHFFKDAALICCIKASKIFKLDIKFLRALFLLLSSPPCAYI